MNLFLVQWGKQSDTGRSFEERSKDFVWAETEQEAQQWGEKQARNTLDTKVSVVWAAATTENKGTPNGLDTYEVKQGKRL